MASRNLFSIPTISTSQITLSSPSTFLPTRLAITARSHRRKIRRRPPDRRDMSSIVSIPELPRRRDSEESLLLDSRISVAEGDTVKSDVEGVRDGSVRTQTRKGRNFSSRKKVLGVELSPDNFAVAMVYFVQGVLGLARLAVSFYLKDDLHLDPAETAVITGLSSLPWLVKPLYGFISDSVPLFGYRRRSYLVLSGLLGAFSWSLMAGFVDSKYSAASCILLGSLSVAFSDVVCRRWIASLRKAYQIWKPNSSRRSTQPSKKKGTARLQSTSSHAAKMAYLEPTDEDVLVGRL